MTSQTPNNSSVLYNNTGALVAELHGHHMTEDRQHFAVLERTDPISAQGLVIFDKDRHALNGQLHSMVAATNAILEELLAELKPYLGRHFEDEEDLVVPVLLKHEPVALAY